jgi:hypothetical protein
MKNYYIKYGRRHPIPSTVEILDELRSGLVPGYVRKSWAQFGFVNDGASSNGVDHDPVPTSLQHRKRKCLSLARLEWAVP